MEKANQFTDLEINIQLVCLFVVIILVIYMSAFMIEKIKESIYTEENINKTTNYKDIIDKDSEFNFTFKIISNPSNLSNSNSRFSILSYNILSQNLLFKSKKDIKRLDLSSNSRANKVIRQIELLNPDIFCLQEVTNFTLAELKKIFEMKYQIKQGNNENATFFNVTGYKKNRFLCINYYSLSFKSINNNFDVKGNRGVLKTLLMIKGDDERKNESIKSSCKERAYSNSNNVNNTNNNLILNKNKADNNDYLTIYNVHFPWRPEHDLYKTLILSEIYKDIIISNCSNKQSNNHNNIKKENKTSKKAPNVFVIGDFNSIPDSLVTKAFYIRQYFSDIFKIKRRRVHKKYLNKRENKNSNNNINLLRNSIKSTNNNTILSRYIQKSSHISRFLNTLNFKSESTFKRFAKELIKFDKERKTFIKNAITKMKLNKEIFNIKEQIIRTNLNLMLFEERNDLYMKQLLVEFLIEFFSYSFSISRLMTFESAYKNYKLGNDTINSSTQGFNSKPLDNHPDFTNYTDKFKDTLDYIFYTSNNLRLLRIVKLPDAKLIDEDCLPNSIYPSDHLVLYSEFEIKK